MSTSFTRTRNQLKTMILAKLGITSTSSTEADQVYEMMDMHLKRIHRLGIFWRKVAAVPYSFSITANVNSASAAADILFPIKITVRDGTDDKPVMIVGPREYAEIRDKTLTGVPEKALWKGGTEWLFWPISTVNTVAKLNYEKIIDDTADATAPDVEVSMLLSLRDIIAYDLSDTFKQPEAKIVRLRADYERAEKDIRKLNALRVDSQPVPVDDFGSGYSHRGTDYGWLR